MNMKDTLDLGTFLIALVGCVSGLYATWRLHRDARQSICITSSRTQKDWYIVTNHSLRPIPIQDITLFARCGRDKFKSLGNVEIRGIHIPGILAPESSFEVSWTTMEQILDTMMYYDEYYLLLTTQTGKKIKSHKIKKYT